MVDVVLLGAVVGAQGVRQLCEGVGDASPLGVDVGEAVLVGDVVTQGGRQVCEAAGGADVGDAVSLGVDVGEVVLGGDGMGTHVVVGVVAAAWGPAGGASEGGGSPGPEVEPLAGVSAGF